MPIERAFQREQEWRFVFSEYPSLVSEISIFVERLMTLRILSVQRHYSQNRQYLGKYWCDAAQTCSQQCTPGKKQNDAPLVVFVTMVLLSASVPCCYEPKIYLFIYLFIYSSSPVISTIYIRRIKVLK